MRVRPCQHHNTSPLPRTAGSEMSAYDSGPRLQQLQHPPRPPPSRRVRVVSSASVSAIATAAAATTAAAAAAEGGAPSQPAPSHACPTLPATPAAVCVWLTPGVGAERAPPACLLPFYCSLVAPLAPPSSFEWPLLFLLPALAHSLPRPLNPSLRPPPGPPRPPPPRPPPPPLLASRLLPASNASLQWRI